MKALTIWQPWASLIIAGAKPFEFRDWPAPRWIIGQRIVIHAGARAMRRSEVEDLQQRLADPDAAWTTGLHGEKARQILQWAWLQAGPQAKQRGFFDSAGHAYTPLPLSAGLGTAIVGAPVDGWDACETFGHKVNDSDRDGQANFAWPMLEIERWPEAQVCRGAQGFWNWPEATAFAEAM